MIYYLYDFSKRKFNEKIKIGYVSYDFQNHAVSNFIIPILENHNKNYFEIYIFNNNLKYNNFKYNNIKLININNLSTINVCNLIYSYEIDILFDLNGHTEGNRLDVFSKNPSPIQISYIGFPNTTGLESIKYRISDKIADNINSTQEYSEKIIYLPKCFLFFKTLGQNEKVSYREVDDYIILGCLNREKKNSLKVLDTWKNILQKCDKTKIIIKIDGKDNFNDKISFYKNILKINEDRIILLNKIEHIDYINLFYKIDILLDTFPYSGTTTTCNALYNSIPVITLYNKDIHSHNVSSSLLINSDLSELVAYNYEEYIDKVVDLYLHKDKINNYKRIIHDKFMKLMNIDTFMEDYEKLLSNLYFNYKNIKI